MPDGDRPKSDVLTGISVRISPVATLSATENKTFPVRRFNMTTPRTAPAGIAGGNQLRRNPPLLCLIRNKKLPSGVGPPMYFLPEGFSLPQGRVLNVLEVFHDDLPGINIDGVFHQCFRCNMEKMFRYGFFSLRQPDKKSARGASAYGLDFSTPSANACAKMVKFPTVEEKGLGVIGVGGDHQPFNPEVNSNNAPRGFSIGDVNLMGEDQEPAFTFLSDFGIKPQPLGEKLAHKNKGLSPESNPFLGNIEIPPPDNREAGLLVFRLSPSSLRFHGSIRGRNNLAERKSDLGGKAKVSSQVSIVSFPKSVGIYFPRVKDDTREPIDRGNVPGGNGQQVAMPVFSDFQLDGANSFHYNRYYSMLFGKSTREESVHSSPPTRGGVSCT